MIKSSKHILNYQNTNKTLLLDNIFSDFYTCTQSYVDMILKKELPLTTNLSSKELPIISFEHSKWRQTAYKEASSIVRSNMSYIKNKTYNRYKKVYKYFSKHGRQTEFLSKRFNKLNIDYLHRIKIDIKNISIPVRSDLFNIQQGNHFDHFIRITTPYKKSDIRYQTINIPIKEHKQSLKYKDWNRKDYIQLTKNDKEQMFIGFVYEKESTTKRDTGCNIGFDSGYKKLLSDSNGTHYGVELNNIYDQLSKKQRGSKSFKRLLIHKKNTINKVVNQIPLDNTLTVVVEDLEQVKTKSKLNTKIMNKMQYWSYKQVLDKLEDRSELEGFYFIKVNPAYTSQTCSSCSTVNKSNRKGEIYNCTCGLTMDADTNAAINILHRGVYSSSNKES